MARRKSPPKVKLTSDVSAYPFMLVRQGARPDQYKYFPSVIQARNEVLEDLEALRDKFLKLGASDAIAACGAAIAHVQHLTAPVTHRVDVLVDPYTNYRYRAEIVRRQA